MEIHMHLIHFSKQFQYFSITVFLTQNNTRNMGIFNIIFNNFQELYLFNKFIKYDIYIIK